MGSSAANAAGINVSSTSPTSFSLVAPVSTSVPVFTHNVALSASSVPAAPTTIIPLSNTQQVINLKLTNTNYLFWRIQMKLYLIGQGLFFFCRWLDDVSFSAQWCFWHFNYLQFWFFLSFFDVETTRSTHHQRSPLLFVHRRSPPCGGLSNLC